MKAPSTHHHIRGLDSLRGLMALWVAAAHTLMTFDIYVPGGLAKVLNVAFAVDVFIILSGFVIFLLLDTQRESFTPFIVRRAFRLFPVYLIALFLSAVTLDWQISLWQSLDSTGSYYSGRMETLAESRLNFWPHFTAHLFLLQGLFSDALAYSDFTFLEPAWSLSLEWQFYLVAPLIFYGLINTRKNHQLIIFALIMAATYGLCDAGYLANNLHYFIVGMASYFLFKHRERAGITSLPLVCLCIALTLRNIPLTIWFFTLFSVLGKNWIAVTVQRFLNAKPLMYIGKVSYPIYVIHTLMIFPALVLSRTIVPGSTSLIAILTISLTLVFTLCISALLHHWVEIPLIRKGKQLSLSLRA